MAKAQKRTQAATAAAVQTRAGKRSGRAIGRSRTLEATLAAAPRVVSLDADPAEMGLDPTGERIVRRLLPFVRECFEWRARWIRLGHELRRSKKHGPVLRKYGLGGSKTTKEGRSPLELERLADAWINMCTAPAGPWIFPRQWMLDLAWENMAATWGKPATERVALPNDFWFQADCDTPMAYADAKRNFAEYVGISEKYVLALLRQIDKYCTATGRQGLPGLPPPRRRLARTL